MKHYSAWTNILHIFFLHKADDNPTKKPTIFKSKAPLTEINNS